MSVGDAKIRDLIYDQAGDWFAAHRIGNLNPGEEQAFRDWLMTSPLHIEEYLAVTLIAAALPKAADDPERPLDDIFARIGATGPSSVRTFLEDDSSPMPASGRPPHLHRRWLAAAAVLVVAAAGGLLWWSGDAQDLRHYATGHGDQQTLSLADHSVLHLNTDTAVTVRYSRTEREVDIERGQAFFVVSHDPRRRFRVMAGLIDVVAVGTQFDVYRQGDSTVVTVAEGRVTVGPRGVRDSRLTVSDGEQARIIDGRVPAAATPVDAQRRLAWLRRQIAFDHEPLAAVAAEFNRYGAIPIEIESPSLRTLRVSGVFSADDTETFLAFLRSLQGTTVEITPNRIRVTRQSAPRRRP